MAIETKRWDVAEYLDNPEMIAAYLSAAMEENDTAGIAQAIGNIARARGMSDLAKKTGIPRGTLYKALAENGNPTLDTVTKVFKALGLRLHVEPNLEMSDAA